MADEPDFDAPRWLIHYYHFIASFSLFMNMFGVYLVLFQCQKMDNFRYFLMVFQILCALTDIHSTCLMQPIPLYPLLAGYTVGILPTYFGVYSDVTMAMAIVLIISQVESLLICFEKKHQAIASILEVHKFPRHLFLFIYFISILFPIVFCVWFYSTSIPKEEQWRYLEDNYPQYVQNFTALPNFEVYIKSTSYNILMVSMLFGGFFAFSLFAFLMSDMFYMMNKLKSKISPVTWSKHREAMRSLEVQLATSLFCILPPCFFIGVIYLNVPKPQLLTEISVAWFAAHSSINVISLIIFFPPYRTFVRKMFYRYQNLVVIPVVSASG